MTSRISSVRRAEIGSLRQAEADEIRQSGASRPRPRADPATRHGARARQRCGDEVGCWMEACVARTRIGNAGEMNGFSRRRIRLALDCLPVERGASAARCAAGARYGYRRERCRGPRAFHAPADRGGRIGRMKQRFAKNARDRRHRLGHPHCRQSDSSAWRWKRSASRLSASAHCTPADDFIRAAIETNAGCDPGVLALRSGRARLSRLPRPVRRSRYRRHSALCRRQSRRRQTKPWPETEATIWRWASIRHFRRERVRPQDRPFFSIMILTPGGCQTGRLAMKAAPRTAYPSRLCLLIDFGSAPIRSLELSTCGRAHAGSGQGPSTVGDRRDHRSRPALADLGGSSDHCRASNTAWLLQSAAGGLRMVTIGLVSEFTAEAARRPRSAPAPRLVGTFAYRLDRRRSIANFGLSPDVILLAGGTDGGNADVITRNARWLRNQPRCPIVVAGNRDVAQDLVRLLQEHGKIAVLTDNVMPGFGELDIDPAREAIRQVFIDRIVHAKGIDRRASALRRGADADPGCRARSGASFSPTAPAAKQGLGDLLVVDIGGATTDVHSVCAAQPGTLKHHSTRPARASCQTHRRGRSRHAAQRGDAIIATAGIGAIAALRIFPTGNRGACRTVASRYRAACRGGARRPHSRRALAGSRGRSFRQAPCRHARNDPDRTRSGDLVQTGKDLTAVADRDRHRRTVAHAAPRQRPCRRRPWPTVMARCPCYRAAATVIDAHYLSTRPAYWPQSSLRPRSISTGELAAPSRQGGSPCPRWLN